MEEDDEDFEALFFTECEELLSDLQEHLDLLLSGEGDEETLNAAFRAVHSVKGGAAAFGFENLIAFAHKFESVMDLGRSGTIELTTDVCQVLLRSGDVMELLIEKARESDTSRPEAMDKVYSELEAIASGATGESPATSDDAPGKVEEPPAVEDASSEEDEQQTRSVQFFFKPDPSFFVAGHDMLRLVNSAKELGLTEIAVEGDVPALSEFSLSECPVSWRLSFDTNAADEALEEFFMVYEAAATWERSGDTVEQVSEPTVAKPEDETKEAERATEEPVEKKLPPSQNAKPLAKKSDSASKKPGVSKSLRVELARVDRLVNLVGEIVITQAALAQKLGEVGDNIYLEIEHSVEAMTRQTRDLQESVMAIRAQPVKSVFSRMPRVVRDLADKLGKDVRLELSGEQTEVDTTVIEELAEPLTHMLRNSMDHGLEFPDEREKLGKSRTGLVTLAAEHRGERVIITIADDGRGINREVVLKKAIERGLVSEEDKLTAEEIDQLIFHAGFSTAKEVSSVSGRGVGMDVVKRKIQELGGRCWLKSEPGKGCIFTIALPLTLAVLEGMTIAVGDERYIVPLSNVVEALRLSSTELRKMPDDSRVISRRGEYLPVLSIRKALHLDPQEEDEDLAIIVDTESNGHVAILIDELIGQRQVVLKSLEANYHRVEGVSGATILGDGRVALILDVPNLINMNTTASSGYKETLH